MENLRVLNQRVENQKSFADFEDLTNFLDAKYYNMLESTITLDNLFWDLEKEGITASIISSLDELVSLLWNEFKKLFLIEGLIYKEMKLVMPGQSSAAAFKSENDEILNLLDVITTMLSHREDLKHHKDLLQAEIIALAGLIERDIHKKGSIMIHEARTMIPEGRLNEIVHAVNIKNILTS